MPPIKDNHNDDVYTKHFNKLNNWSQALTNYTKISIFELGFFLSFSINFLVARIIHFTSQPEEVYNYYNDKRNFLNQVFVKKGWGWTTLVIMIFYSLLFLHNQHIKVQTSQQKISTLKNALIKYVLVTGWWILFTQWCFGLPIMDKIFVWTGGKCTGIKSDKYDYFLQNSGDVKSVFKAITNTINDNAFYESSDITSYTCKKLRGNWIGGHDPSGHVFLMIHSSLYLFLEVAPFWYSWTQLKHSVQKLITGTKNNSSNILSNLKVFAFETPHILVILLISMWWFMLLMTNMYFHSIAEKVVGLFFGYIGIIAVYYIPRWLK